MKFIDEAKISVRSGHGGPGVVSWRREKFVPRGGPDGGDGGAGGNVIFQVNPQLGTLLDFKFNKRFFADDGDPGERQNMTGHNGGDMLIQVPPGTLIKNLDGTLVRDLGTETEPYVFLKGGRGGKGNQFFKNSVNQAPKFSQPGEAGVETEIYLELKLMADVGIIGFPNAGKSTLISRISAARPKIADYPFTTLVPNLGVVQAHEYKSFVVADIPGLIKGAHEGAGLGTKFLRHIERTRFFVHLIDASDFSQRDPVQDYLDINHELKMYDAQRFSEEGFFELSTRAQIVVLNKIETLSTDQLNELRGRFKKIKVDVLCISAVTGSGVRILVDKMAQMLPQADEDVLAPTQRRPMQKNKVEEKRLGL